MTQGDASLAVPTHRIGSAPFRRNWTPGESRHLHIGNHGGTSEDEMLIPLILEAT